VSRLHRVHAHESEGRFGELIEFAPTADLFNAPQDGRTEAYITGRFG